MNMEIKKEKVLREEQKKVYGAYREIRREYITESIRERIRESREKV